jgi:hypothetical protein
MITTTMIDWIATNCNFLCTILRLVLHSGPPFSEKTYRNHRLQQYYPFAALEGKLLSRVKVIDSLLATNSRKGDSLDNGFFLLDHTGI